MSKELLSFFLSELTTVRIICGKEHCGAVLEVPIARLGATFQHKDCRCPCCGQDFQVYETTGTGRDPFAPFAKAVTALTAIDARVKVEFVIPAPVTPADSKKKAGGD